MYIVCTLYLLSSLCMLHLFLFQVKLNIDVVALQREIACLSRTKPHSTVSTITQQQVEPDLFFQSTELSLLLQWCREVGRLYGLQVSAIQYMYSGILCTCICVYIVHVHCI